jgi:hypothetical protein
MKKRILNTAIFTILALIGTLGQAQAETLLGDKIHDNGWSIGGSMMVSNVDGNAIAMSGMRLHWIINRNLGIGFYDYGTMVEEDHNYNNMNPEYHLTFSGMDIEYTVNPDDVLHWGGSLALGGGHIDFRRNDVSGLNGDPDDDFFFVQPMLHTELNVIKRFKLGASAGYRFTNGVDTINLSNRDMNGYVLALTLKYSKP